MRTQINRKSRTTDVDALAILILAAYVSSGLTGDERLIAIIEILKGLSAELNLAISHIKTESKLLDKNGDRVVAVRFVYKLVSGYSLSSDVAINTASNKVLDVLNHYGSSITGNKGYGEETSLVKSLLVDLSTAEMLQYIAVLPGVSVAIAELQTKETEFEESNLAFETSKAEEGKIDNASELKLKVGDTINSVLVNYLYILTVLGEEGYDDFIDVLNQLITDNNVKVKKRLNITENDVEDEEEEED